MTEKSTKFCHSPTQHYGKYFTYDSFLRSRYICNSVYVYVYIYRFIDWFNMYILYYFDSCKDIRIVDD